MWKNQEHDIFKHYSWFTVYVFFLFRHWTIRTLMEASDVEQCWQCLSKDKAWITPRYSFLGWLLFCYFFILFVFECCNNFKSVFFCFKTSCWLLILKDVDAFCKVLWSCLPWLWKIRVEISSKDVPFQGKSEFLLVCCNVMFRDYGLMIFCV